MAGLLDFLNSDEARMGIGLMAAGAPQTDPSKTGFGNALQTAQGSVDAWKKQQAATALAQSQMLENMSQAQERQLKAATAAKQQQFLSNPFNEDGTFNWQGSIEAQIDPAKAKEYAQLHNASKTKVHGSVEGVDANGQPGNYQVDEFGAKVPGSFTPKFVAPHFANLGGSVAAIDPVSRTIQNQFGVTADPNAVLASETTQRGQDMTQEGQVWKAKFEEAAKADAAKNGPLNDVQGKALLFGSNMQQANGILDTLSAKGVDVSIPGRNKGWGTGFAINALQPKERQALDQAKRNFTTAWLRRISGAAVTEGEIETAEKQFFPQPGEGADVIEQKRQNRLLAMEGVKAEVPNYDVRIQGINDRIAAIPKPIPASASAAKPAIAQLPAGPSGQMTKTVTVNGQPVKAQNVRGIWVVPDPNAPSGWAKWTPD